MTYALQDYRNLARELLDLTTDDISDTLIDSWVREGDSRIVNAKERWSFLEGRWTLHVYAGQATYVVEDDLGADIDRVEGVRGDHGKLLWIGTDEGESRWGNSSQTGDPRYWSEWAGELTLYPTPSQEVYLSVRGYLKRHDWVAEGAGGRPPYDPDLQGALLNWVYGKTYAHQEDPDTSVFYLDLFDDELTRMRARKDVTPTPQPLVLGGSPRRTFLGRPLFPWEG
jgi:hypothetical protein